MIRNDHAGVEGLNGDKEAKGTSRGSERVRLTQIYCLDYRSGHGMLFIIEDNLDMCSVSFKHHLYTLKTHKCNE